MKVRVLQEARTEALLNKAPLSDVCRFRYVIYMSINIYYDKQRNTAIALLGDKCFQCNSKNNLEFDHVDWRTKMCEISTLLAAENRARLTEELTKCQLLCHDCHVRKTRQDQSEMKTKPLNHGSMHAWMRKKCRCDICLSARRVWYDKRNIKRREGLGRGPYGQPADHGTILMYHRGCKCDLCRKANAQNVRKLRTKSRE